MIAYSSLVIADRLQALTRAIDAAGTPGALRIYGGTAPARAGAAVADQPLLASVEFGYPSSAGVTGTALSLSIALTTPVQATGAPTWARIVDGHGRFVADLDVGVAGAAVQIGAAKLYEGGDLVSDGILTLSEV
ncbi:hypothetical protein [Ralstonia solanacearum]|uniref:hypothetical protein n=1 Tax=Ralstonia solanacearum TaxID=305 RepID=UPI0005AC627B|nr:hypothetical protein [Ralstonia solanacearum]QNT25375.1 hypothetical protein C2I38_25275 [Ralstonia solanacearum]QNT63022.1 hypothetical protein C2L97_25320 [Ralstonia solanacearum]